MLRQPIYIDLEGADLTGKSTLLKTTFKESEYSKIMCFHDRGILTHHLYNKVFNRYEEDNLLWHNELYNFVQNNGLIILTASISELVNRYQTRSDDLFKLPNIIKMNEAYEMIYRDFLYAFKTVKLIKVDNKTPLQVYEEAENHYIYMLGRGTV